MFDPSRRRTRAPIVYNLAIGVASAFGGIGTGELIGWFVLPQYRALHPPLAVLVGMVVAGLAVVIVLLRRLYRYRRSAS
jgi:hypothetical protein